VIIVITNKDKSESSGRNEIIVSHGINVETGQVVILPTATPEQIGAIFDEEIGEYVLPFNRPATGGYLTQPRQSIPVKPGDSRALRRGINP
jgi:hypothetical protein